MKQLTVSSLFGILLISLVTGCGSKPGVDASKISSGVPKSTTIEVDKEESMKKLIKDLQEADARQAILYCGAIALRGAEAESALPALQEIVDNENEDPAVKEAAKVAIEKINDAIAAAN